MDYEKKRIEKLEHPWADNNSGCGGASYDDIIDKINEIVDVLNGKEELELRESEDERIRKELVNFIIYKAGHLVDEKTEHRFVTYLEKQKEQKEEIISISEMVSKYRNTDEYDDDGNYKGKPVNCMIRAYEQGIRDTLSKVKEQKPVEWSEEDEKMFCNLIGIMEGKTGVIPGGWKKYVDWLKNRFRYAFPMPHWKPSDHQMNILKAVKEYVGRGSGYWGEGLGSLIEDLEKLI